MRCFPLTLPLPGCFSLEVLCTECALFVIRNHHWIAFLQKSVHFPSQTMHISKATGAFSCFHSNAAQHSWYQCVMILQILAVDILFLMYLFLYIINIFSQGKMVLTAAVFVGVVEFSTILSI